MRVISAYTFAYRCISIKVFILRKKFLISGMLFIALVKPFLSEKLCSIFTGVTVRLLSKEALHSDYDVTTGFSNIVELLKIANVVLLLDINPHVSLSVHYRW